MNNLKILNLNCQKAYNSSIKNFFERILRAGEYDFLLLQEVDSKMEALIKEINSSYLILNKFDNDISENSHVCILYRSKFTLEESSFISFATFDPKRFPHGWGFIQGIFNINNIKVCVASVHLTSGLNPAVRMREVRIIKENLTQQYPVIVAGDFNSGFPGEIVKAESTFSPEFIRINKGLASTLDSRYSERSTQITNRIATFLGRFNIAITLKTDHIYASKSFTQNFSCKILADRISDHSPIECNINIK